MYGVSVNTTEGSYPASNAVELGMDPEIIREYSRWGRSISGPRWEPSSCLRAKVVSMSHTYF